MDKDSAITYVHQLLHATLDKGASDLFITSLASPSVKANGKMVPLSDQQLTPEQAGFIVRSIMNDKQLKVAPQEWFYVISQIISLALKSYHYHLFLKTLR